MIFFVCLRTSQQVHAQALGFTNMVMYFAEDENADKAGLKAVTHFQTKYGIKASVSTVSVALRQNKKHYCFPESIL